MKKKDLINEIAGVPQALTSWVNILNTVIMDKLDELVSSGWEEEADGELEHPKTGEPTQITVYKSDKVYDGDDVMDKIVKASGYSNLKEFLQSDTYKDFPIWKPILKLNVLGIPNDMLEYSITQEGYQLNASIETDPANLKITKLGKNVAFPGLTITFDPILPDTEKLSEEIKKTISKKLKPVIAHELLHGYQQYMQIKGGGKTHFGPEAILNSLVKNPLVQDEVLKDWNDFLHLVYLHLSFEVNARVTELYYEMKEEGVETKEDFIRVLKNTHIWDEVNRLKKFNAEEYIENFKIPGMGGDNLFDMIHSLGDRLMLSSKGIDTEDKESTLKSLIKIWDAVVTMGSKAFELKYGLKIPMSKVPQSAKEDPYKFFQFFEKRFHKKAKDFERKLYKVASILINQ
jgi:hypothetical protein